MSRAISIHVGLNSVDPDHYEGWDGKLRACEQDARDMARLAGAAGFQVVTPLLTTQATVAQFVAAMESAREELGSGDIMLLTYSGHGGQVADENGEELDGLDETWCLFDRQFVDDELHDLLASFKPGVRIVVLSDSCHSGTVTKMREFRSRYESDIEQQVEMRCMPSEQCDRVYSKWQHVYDAIQRRTNPRALVSSGASVLLISGCQDNQFSLDGPRNGAFTGRLLKVWGNGAFQGSYRELCRRVAALLPATQAPNLFQTGAPDAGFADSKAFDSSPKMSRNARESNSWLWGDVVRAEGYVPAAADSGRTRGGGRRDASIPGGLDDLSEAISRAYDLSVSAAVDVGIPIAGSVSGGFSRRVIVLERAAFRTIAQADGTKQEWGYAVRFCVTVNKFDASMKLSLPFLAASAQVGSIEAQWMLHVVGLSGPKIDAASLAPTDLNVETFVLAKQSLQQLIEAVRHAETKFSAQLLGQTRASDVLRADFQRCIGRTLGLDALAEGHTLQRVQSRVTDSVRLDHIRDVYREVANVTLITDTPSSESRQEASKLLGRVSISN
jgi:metacaspase-1